MIARFTLPDDMQDDIPSMHQFFLNSVNEKYHQCITQGVEQYLGRKLTDADAPHMRYDTRDEHTHVYYDDKLIGSMQGRWESTEIMQKYMWEWTPENK